MFVKKPTTLFQAGKWTREDAINNTSEAWSQNFVFEHYDGLEDFLAIEYIFRGLNLANSEYFAVFDDLNLRNIPSGAHSLCIWAVNEGQEGNSQQYPMEAKFWIPMILGSGYFISL